MNATVVPDMTEADYFAHPALSSSGAKLLLAPSCPAIYAWRSAHPPAPIHTFDVGHAAHALVLGVGAPIVEVDAPDWRSKDARAAREAAHADGAIPLLAADAGQVRTMAAVLRAHPVASALLHPERGAAEQSIFWRDARHGVDRRARLDWLPNTAPGRRMIAADYKTTASADPGEIVRACARYGYHRQVAWYLDAITALGLDPDPAMLLIFQDKNPPHPVTVVELDEAAIAAGRAMNALAMDVYARCTATGTWPGYSDDVVAITLPAWATALPEETR